MLSLARSLACGHPPPLPCCRPGGCPITPHAWIPQLLLDDGRLGLIDFGQAGFLTAPQQCQLARTVVAVASRDIEAMAHEAIGLGMRTQHNRTETLAFHLGAPWGGDLLHTLSLARVYEKHDRLLHRGDGQYVVALRPIILIRALCVTMGMRIHMAEALAPAAQRMLAERDAKATAAVGGVRSLVRRCLHRRTTPTLVALAALLGLGLALAVRCAQPAPATGHVDMAPDAALMSAAAYMATDPARLTAIPTSV